MANAMNDNPAKLTNKQTNKQTNKVHKQRNEPEKKQIYKHKQNKQRTKQTNTKQNTHKTNNDKQINWPAAQKTDAQSYTFIILKFKNKMWHQLRCYLLHLKALQLDLVHIFLMLNPAFPWITGQKQPAPLEICVTRGYKPGRFAEPHAKAMPWTDTTGLKRTTESDAIFGPSLPACRALWVDGGQNGGGCCEC